MTEPSMPRKVLRIAQVLGVHNDCLISQNPCAECTANINTAFDFHYGDARSEEELWGRILDDMRLDILDEI